VRFANPFNLSANICGVLLATYRQTYRQITVAKNRSLPPGLLIQTAQFIWRQMWQVMMGQMAPRDRAGAYQRPTSQFRQTITQGETGRYRLFVGLGCPWAHRTLVVRALKGLEAAIAVSPVSPSPKAGGWVLDQPFTGCQTLAELYTLAQSDYTGRYTVPVLWDDQEKQIINNESAEIIIILNQAFNDQALQADLDLYPEPLQPEIDQWNTKIYDTVNNGVYRCGFAQTQGAYHQAFTELFTTLDELDQALAQRRYLCGAQLTLADVRLFTTLFRFDVVYYSLFKCNRQRIQDYGNLGPYLRDIYQIPGVKETCNLEAVKRDYYGNLFPLNPGGLIPEGPDIRDLMGEHDRQHLT
jgi:putative glutathione S-transferase